ncbi:MAG: hypothetical protein ACXU9C_07605, partial [Xanthobacteraceae bacterium]
MLTKRTSVLALATVTTLALAASSDADASPFCHRGGFASFSRPYIPVMPQQRIVSVKPKFEEKVARPANKYHLSPVVSKIARVHPTETETAPKPANSYQPTQLAGAATVAPVSAPATAATATCLTKEYLDTGAVLFKDVCTQEWAMNSTNVSNKLSAVGRSCLTKDNSQDGVIVFKDVCTQEWAMNTV